MSRRTEHRSVFAVVRVSQGYPHQDLAGSEVGPGILFNEFDVTVKEIVTTAEEAEREVARLNHLNATQDCRYFWTGTRYFPDGGSFGSAPRAQDAD